MNAHCMLSAALNLKEAEIRGKRIIEVGACSINGSIRPLMESYQPKEYIGVDISKGPSVDMVCAVDELVSKFGKQSFDVVISTEMLEHVKDWRKAFHNLKAICRENGILFLTTRSYGFVYHAYPYDYWRYEVEDIQRIFEDFRIEALEKDPEKGVFVKCRKPVDFRETDLSGIELYSIVADRRVKEVTAQHLRSCRFRKLTYKTKAREYLYGKVDKYLKKFLRV